jgi:Protein of unknown function (DUF3293)
MTAETGGWDAYAGAVIRIEAPSGMIWVRPAPVTRTSGDYPDPEGRAIYVITAHNPGGKMASDTENASAGTKLEEELERQGLTWCPAAGGDPSWTHLEPGAAVIGMDEAGAVALGARFGQEAIFALTPADRRVIGCADQRVAATGWSIEPDAAADLSVSADVDETVRCWCDWSETDPDAGTHEEHITANDYPDHEVSPEWNVPEPAEDGEGDALLSMSADQTVPGRLLAWARWLQPSRRSQVGSHHLPGMGLPKARLGVRHMPLGCGLATVNHTGR